MRQRVRLPVFYGMPPALEDYWIAYFHQEPIGLISSVIVMVRDATGEVTYYGSANDEG
jgi:hypothetical protein